MDNTFYDVYSSIKRTKTLWEVLDKKYKVEDVDMKKFIINNFLDFKMIDFKDRNESSSRVSTQLA